jgi:hypothetical protein
MQLHQAKTLEMIELAGDEGSSEVPTQPATLDPWDFSTPNRDEILWGGGWSREVRIGLQTTQPQEDQDDQARSN